MKETEIERIQKWASQSFRGMRGNRTQAEIAEKAGVSVKTVRNAESGEILPSFETLVHLLWAYEPTIDSIIQLLELETYMGNDAAYDASKIHRDRLEAFENQSYLCIFMSNNKPDGEVDILKIGPFRYSSQGFSAAKASIGENKYDCKVTVSKTGHYAFMSFTSSDMLSDRAFFIIPFDCHEKRFFAAKGVMLSLVEDVERIQDVPCFQMMFIISQSYSVTNELLEYCKRHLVLSGKSDEHRFRVDNIRRESKAFAKEIKLRLEQNERKPSCE